MGSKRQTNLYHCTKSDSLLKILESKYFRYSYCMEEYYGRIDDRFTNKRIAYPMVCFADLYTNELKEHMHQFNADSYIMMEKSWADEKQVCPVIYYNQNSLSNWAFLAMNLYAYDLDLDIAKLIEKNHQVDEKGANLIRRVHQLYKSIEQFRPFFKKYKGQYYIKDENRYSNKTTEFFLEREWRSFPAVHNRERIFLWENEYRNQNILNNAVRELERNNKLEFKWKDIKKIGCQKDKKAVVIKTLMNSFGITTKEAKTKIVSVNLNNDKCSDNV